MMLEQVRYQTKITQAGIFLVRYQTKIWHAGMPMPALVSSMLMPSYAMDTAVNRFYSQTISLFLVCTDLYFKSSMTSIYINPNQNGVRALLIKNGQHLSDLSGSDQSEGEIIYPILYRCRIL
jgi:hypothetical protein